MAETLSQLLSDQARLRSFAKEVLGSRERLPTTELGDCLMKLCNQIKVTAPTDLILAVTEEVGAELTGGELSTVLRNFLNKLAERQTRSSDTPAIPVLKAARKHKSRSQNHTPLRANPRSLPLPSYPVSVSVFYQDGQKGWSEKSEHHCQLQSERSNLAEYNLLLRRFPELQRSMRASMDFDRPRAVSPTKEPRYCAPTERHIAQQRTIVNSPGKAGYKAPRAFIPANPSEARDKLDRPVHGYQGSPYEAKRTVYAIQDDYIEYLRSKETRIASSFKPAYVGEHLVDRSLYLNSQLSPAAFTQKTSSKRVTHSQTFYP